MRCCQSSCATGRPTVVRALDRRVAAGQTEEEALSALVKERLPDVAAHGERVARYAQSVARELDVDSARRRMWRSPPAFTTSASWQCPSL